MKMLDREIKVVAAEDGKAWLCFPVSSGEIEGLLAFASDLVGRCRALRYKVRTAELTKDRQELGKVA